MVGHSQIMFSNSIENGQIESDAILNHFPRMKTQHPLNWSVPRAFGRSCQSDNIGGSSGAWPTVLSVVFGLGNGEKLVY